MATDEEVACCAFCQDYLVEEESLITLLCGHAFHHSCCVEFLLVRSALDRKCPLCNRKITKKEKKKIFELVSKVLIEEVQENNDILMYSVTYYYMGFHHEYVSTLEFFPLRLLFERFSKKCCSLCGEDLDLTTNVVQEPMIFIGFILAGCLRCKSNFFVAGRNMIKINDMTCEITYESQ